MMGTPRSINCTVNGKVSKVVKIGGVKRFEGPHDKSGADYKLRKRPKTFNAMEGFANLLYRVMQVKLHKLSLFSIG